MLAGKRRYTNTGYIHKWIVEVCVFCIEIPNHTSNTLMMYLIVKLLQQSTIEVKKPKILIQPTNTMKNVIYMI